MGGASIGLVLAVALAPTSAPGTSPEVAIVIAAEQGGRARIEDRLREFVHELPAAVSFEHRSAIGPEQVLQAPVALTGFAVWVDAAQPAGARIYIVDRGADRILIRALRLDTGLDEVALDEIATIVRSSLDALLAGGTVGITRASAREQLGVAVPPPVVVAPIAPPSKTSPSTRPTPWLTIAAGYTVRDWGSEVVQHGPVLDVAAGVERPRLRYGAALEGTFVVPVEVRAGDLALGLVGGGLRISARLDARIDPRWSWDSALGGGVDLIRDRSRALAPTASGTGPTTRPIALVSARSGPAWWVGTGRDRVLLRLQTSLDVELGGFQYVTESDVVVFRPFRVRPGAVFVVGWGRGQPRPVP